MNKVILCGNLGRDPESKTAANGSVHARFSVATRGYNDSTDWHNIVCFGKTAELAQSYLSKGQKVLLEGQIRYGTFTNNEGLEVKTVSIIADRIEFLTPKSEAQPKAESASKSYIPNKTAKPVGQNTDKKEAETSDINWDGIPF